MVQAFKTAIFILIFMGLSMGLFPVMAQINPISKDECTKLGISCSGGTADTVSTLNSSIWTAVNYLLGLIGVVAAIFIIYGGVKYIISLGDEKDTTAAKRIILYAVIGLIVIGLAALIVNFIVGDPRAGSGGALNPKGGGPPVIP